jgi:5-methylcytosine-specific restriction protein A
MKLTALKPRLQTLKPRIAQPARTERMRGRAAVDRRADWLRRHPLCKLCEEAGQVTAAQVVDHTIPLWEGGTDSYETNGQSLCHEHHDAKTAQEAARRARLGT